MSQKSIGNTALPTADADASKDRDRDTLIERNARIGELISNITLSLKGTLKNSNNNTADSSKYKRALLENGSTQTDPFIMPGLKMLVERTGDSVACQTIEKDPFAN
ncbi:uncharacterized protein LOC116806545 [Drosophila grimshawi]|uniref:uncharacterized protein LOC116806545 n=1 Tax=Drosophila grimshawi TaxID=7222 RepID=UPI000C86E830|nr:uncharacterized protein LOC116806545 [Drosophila grimshawi]